MKLFLSLIFLALCGCSSVPKDALVRGLKIGATPWTPAVEAETIATGKAASNLSASERAALLSPR